MTPLQLGTRVTFTHTLKRTAPRSGLRVWDARTYWLVDTARGPVPGIVVGVRTLSDGTADRGWDEPTVYTPTRHFTAYLIAFDLRRKPVLVLPEHVELEA